MRWFCIFLYYIVLCWMGNKVWTQTQRGGRQMKNEAEFINEKNKNQKALREQNNLKH